MELKDACDQLATKAIKIAKIIPAPVVQDEYQLVLPDISKKPILLPSESV
jgi:hypothetical protein